jgi:uncharacterized protein
MKIENSFQVSAPPEQAWELLMDVPRVIPCMPGAELIETLGDDAWRAKVNVKLGPISLTFNSDVKRVEVDEAGSRVRLAATANEARGRGSADATIESSLAAVDGGTKVDIVTDLTLVGSVAQYGRGIVPDVASQLVSRFASCIEKQLVTAEPAPPSEAKTKVYPVTPTPPAKPVAGLRLGLLALAGAVGRFLRRRRG